MFGIDDSPTRGGLYSLYGVAGIFVALLVLSNWWV
jgi:hypothetical protein